jgi:hypothetical protein
MRFIALLFFDAAVFCSRNGSVLCILPRLCFILICWKHISVLVDNKREMRGYFTLEAAQTQS